MGSRILHDIILRDTNRKIRVINGASRWGWGMCAGACAWTYGDLAACLFTKYTLNHILSNMIKCYNGLNQILILNINVLYTS